MKGKRLVKLLKFMDGVWKVDYGVYSKIDVYLAMGYIVTY